MGASTTDVQVLRNREVWNNVELLVNDAQTQITSMVGVLDINLLPLEPNLTARIRLMDTSENLHQRRLTGAVLTTETQDLASVKVKVHVGQRLDARECL